MSAFCGQQPQGALPSRSHTKPLLLKDSEGLSTQDSIFDSKAEASSDTSLSSSHDEVS